MDIKVGDILSISGVKYPIIGVEIRSGLGNTSTFTHLATTTGTTARRPDIIGGERDNPQTVISSLSLTPFEPVSLEIATALGSKHPQRVFQSFAADIDSFAKIIFEDERV
jgi:hypothetical protein